MLLKINGQISERLHAPFVSDAEISAHVSKLISGNENNLEEMHCDSNITHVDFSKKSEQIHDVFYESVIAYIRETKKASTTALQNKFKIGYQKAAGVMEKLEKDGIIGQRTKVNEPREVF